MLTILHLRNAKTGGQYRKTLQYGYDRQQGIDRWMGMKLNGLDPWVSRPNETKEIETELYACGFLMPNYPVPAIVPRYAMHDGTWMQRHPLEDGGYDVIIRDDEGNELDGWWSADAD